VDLLADPDDKVRAVAVDGLWESRDPTLVDRFVDMLYQDPIPEVRARAAIALGTFVLLGELGELDEERFGRAVTALVDAGRSDDEDPEVRRRATESAGYADQSAVRELIRSSKESRDPGIQAGALRAMGNSADGNWEPDVIAGLASQHAELRFEAARAAGELTLQEAIPVLYQLAEADEREIQFEAVWALGEIGGDAAGRALERVGRRTDDPELVGAVEEALAMVALDSFDLDFPILDPDL
jgi:HEAT repeat protein